MEARKDPILVPGGPQPIHLLSSLRCVSGLEISGSEKQAKAGTLQSHGAKLNRLTPLSVAKKNHELRSQCWDSRNQF